MGLASGMGEMVMRIARTTRGYRAASTVWDFDTSYTADTVYEQDYPDTSSVLGPDGEPLQYEPRQAIGFALGSAK